MIVGIGVDVVDVARFALTLQRTPGVAARLLCPGERELTVERMAVRFAAKEAVAKALGAPGGLHWHDVEVVTDADGAPRLQARGTVAAAAAARGVQRWHVSLSHDAGTAVAMVVAEA